MKIKNLFSAGFIALFLLSSSQLFANTNPGDEVPKEVRAKQIETRIMEIRTLAKTENLTHQQKTELRKEVKSLKREAQSRGIYLSIGAIIVIILLLILLLK